MGFRFSRRFHIAPGIRLNVGTRGTSVSIGHRGFWYTIGSHGKRRATLGFPGTGLSYTFGNDAKSGTQQRRPATRRRQQRPAHGGRWSIVVVLLILAGLGALAYHLLGSP
jgi:hypothetical protein